MAAKKLALKKIRLDGGTQIRVTLDEQAIEEYAEAIASGKSLPPATVFQDSAGEYWLADGFHRYEGFDRAGKKNMPVEIVEGELRDAIRYALSANTEHGLRRTNADKRNAVMVALADPEWSQFSSRQIADLCGVSHHLVQSVMKESTGIKFQLIDTAIGKDGKVRPRHRPAAEPAQAPENQGSDEPDDSEGESDPPAITDEQAKNINLLFEPMDEAAVDGWLEPYGVDDWGDLSAPEASELIRALRANAAQESPDYAAVEPLDFGDPRPAAQPAAAAGPSPVAAEETPPQSEPSPDDVVIEIKGSAGDGWEHATIRLTGELADRWREWQRLTAQRNQAARLFNNAVVGQCHFRGVNDQNTFERLTRSDESSTWRAKLVQQAFAAVKQHDLVAPCHYCVSKPNHQCLLCLGSGWVTRFRWAGFAIPSEKLALVKHFGGEVR